MGEPLPPRPAGVGPAATWAEVDGVWAWREGSFRFDEAAADKAVAFFPKHLRFTEGEWAGRPFQLEGWQEVDIIRPMFGWKREDGTRRYRRVFVWVPRKNGKTELAAGVALLMLLGDGEPGGQVFSIALEEAQAGIVFKKAGRMVALGTLGEHLETLKTSIYCPALNASFRPLSGKSAGKHGLNMSGLIGDELHEWKDGSLYTFVHDSSAARRQPLEFLISTAGQKGSHGEQIWNECQAILAGEVDDPETLVVVYAASEGDDWTDEATWRKANPNYGTSVKVEAFASAFRAARQLRRLENDFKRYRLNLWTEQAVRWLPIDAVDDNGKRFGWDHCEGPLGWRELEDRLAGLTAFAGIDLSAVNDLSALVWWFPAQDGLNVPAVLPRFFKPGDLVRQHGKRDRLPYEQWVDEGALIATPGNVVDYEFVREQVFRDAERYRVAYAGTTRENDDQGGIAIDRWNAIETSVKLIDEGLPVVLFGQGFASMSGPAKQLEKLVLGNGFHHGGHPVLRAHARAAAVQQDAAGNIKPAKDKSSSRIDGIVAQTMAVGLSLRGDGIGKRSIYEQRGALVL